MVTPIDTSYEIIWAADLRAPKKAYLELLDHPAMITECTLKDDTAKTYKIPIFRSESTIPSPKGITAHAARAKVNVNIGANTNIIKLELLGKTVSFNNNLTPSANGCAKP